MNGKGKTLLLASDQSKFYSGDCYIFQYSYPGEEVEEHLIGTWWGKQSSEVKNIWLFFPFIIFPYWKNLISYTSYHEKIYVIVNQRI